MQVYRLLLPFALRAAFPRSDYYGRSALGVVHLRPSRRAQFRTGQTIRVPVFRFPTLMPIGGELYPARCGRQGHESLPVSDAFDAPAVGIDEPHRV